MFSIAIKGEPPTFQGGGKKHRTNRLKQEKIKKQISEWLRTNAEFVRFSSPQRLYGRIIYFNADEGMVRDIHNIIKPTFDSLEDLVIDDDHQILHFEGIKLDMHGHGSWFEMEFLDLSVIDPKLLDGKTTWYLIEIGELPFQLSELVKVTWSN